MRGRLSMMWKRIFMAGLAALCMISAFSGCAFGQDTKKPSREHPVTITVWHYYNGAQLTAFSELVDTFNKGVGKEAGIQVQAYSQGTVTELAQSVMKAATGGDGTAMPNIFAAYADTAYALDKMGVLADISAYMSDEDLSGYVEEYIAEGHFTSDGSMKIFPVAKSTEVLTLNSTDWAPFAEATGAAPEDLSTVEGVTETARAYYEWTDAQTPDIENDGRAFFGRDAFANYMLIGAKQLGTTLLNVQDDACTLDFDRGTVRKLWDNYYVPMVAGWFAAENRFRSDDVKLGILLACVGSTSSATYFPDERIVSDTEIVPIEMVVLPAPQFAGGEAFAVQQGAGHVVTKKDSEAEIYGSIEFLKWFTQPENNAHFSVSSGYLPVMKEASEKRFLSGAMERMGAGAKIADTLSVAVETVENNTLYTPQAFPKGNEVRSVLEYAMPDAAAQGRAGFLEMLAAGKTYEEALRHYSSDAMFDAWYEATLQTLNEAVG